jgi:hypothetical protein
MTVRARRLVGLGVVGALVVVAGVIAGAGSAIGEQRAAVAWSYTCAFPSGSEPANVAVTATFPDSATPQGAIQPANVTVSATLPDAAVASLSSLPATTTTATAALSVTVAQHGATSATSWPNLVAPATPLPATGSMSLAFTGVVPSASPTGTGDVTFTAGGLDLRFTPTTADGSAATPATVAVDCTLDGGQNAVLATVPVPAPTLAPPPSEGTAPVINTAPRPGTAPHAFGSAATAPPVDPNCPTPTAVPLVETADIVGRINLNKLGESVSIGDGTIVLTSVGTGLTPQGDFLLCWTAKITLRPSTSTVLTFGFQPTFATMTTTQVGAMIVETWQHNGVPMATTTGLENIALSDVTVNCDLNAKGACVGDGAPLDVGSHCQTSTPAAINLSGIPPYQPLIGGPLEGVLAIPPFAGCGVTEDLDPLLNAPLSGPGDLIRIIQGTPCSSFIPNCVPQPPTFK